MEENIHENLRKQQTTRTTECTSDQLKTLKYKQEEYLKIQEMTLFKQK